MTEPIGQMFRTRIGYAKMLGLVDAGAKVAEPAKPPVPKTLAEAIYPHLAQKET